MAPAIRLARDGFILTCADTDILDTTVKRFRQDPESARIFLRKDGEALQPGDRLVQADLADTLSAISEKGRMRSIKVKYRKLWKQRLKEAEY